MHGVNPHDCDEDIVNYVKSHGTFKDLTLFDVPIKDFAGVPLGLQNLGSNLYGTIEEMRAFLNLNPNLTGKNYAVTDLN